MATVHADLRWPDGRCVVTALVYGSWMWWLEGNAPDEYEHGFPTEADALSHARGVLADHVADNRPPECVFCEQPILAPDWRCPCDAAVIHRLRSEQAQSHMEGD